MCVSRYSGQRPRALRQAICARTSTSSSSRRNRLSKVAVSRGSEPSGKHKPGTFPASSKGRHRGKFHSLVNVACTPREMRSARAKSSGTAPCQCVEGAITPTFLMNPPSTASKMARFVPGLTPKSSARVTIFINGFSRSHNGCPPPNPGKVTFSHSRRFFLNGCIGLSPQSSRRMA